MTLADFYGPPLPPDGGRLALVHGNCQAESLRIVLGGADLRTVRIPPVHELAAGDLAQLRAWVARADVLVSQPVRDDYRGLPIGTGQLGARRTVLVPVIRFAGLYPTQVIVRPPSDPSLVPPVVPYHDVRGLARAAGVRLREPGVRDVRAIGERSLAELRTREARFGTVRASDLFAPRPGFELMRTLNHPGNPIWIALAERVRERLGLPAVASDPGRPLLDGIHAPRAAAVIDAYDIDASPTGAWRVDGAEIDPDEVAAAHTDWYAAHPDAVRAGLTRHADLVELLT